MLSKDVDKQTSPSYFSFISTVYLISKVKNGKYVLETAINYCIIINSIPHMRYYYKEKEVSNINLIMFKHYDSY